MTFEPSLFLDGKVTVFHGDCRQVLRQLPASSIDSIVTDPPYGLGFMGRAWDAPDGAPFAKELWAEALRVLKPGGHLLAFSGTRTQHRMVTAIEDAGFEIRDQMGWAYGSGFPKSMNISKAIDKAAGAIRPIIGHERISNDEAKQWEGWGTALKPAWEPICVARKRIQGTVVDNVLAYGTGGINIEACRVGSDDTRSVKRGGGGDFPHEDDRWTPQAVLVGSENGRFPANIAHDGSADIDLVFPDGAARFFYTAKADATDRIASKHPTIKPLNLIQYYVRLVTPPAGVVLDPFAGTGTTGEAAWREGFRAVLVERDQASIDDIARRMSLADNPTLRDAVVATGNNINTSFDDLPLFGGSGEAQSGSGGGGAACTDGSPGTDNRADRAQTMKAATDA